MSSTYNGMFGLIIWNSERTTYIQLYRSGLTLKFQPVKGMKIFSETNHFIIHDIEWDLEEGTFLGKIVQVEHRVGDSFIDIDFLVHEAERAGWKKAKGDLGEVHEEVNEEFRDYCFSFNEYSFVDDLEAKDYEERFKEIVLDSITDIRERLESMKSIGIKSLLTGVVLGVIISALVQALF